MKANWIELDRKHLWHPYTPLLGDPEPVPVASASGSYLKLSDGREVFDGISSWWVTLHGHCHPRLAEAIAQQARTLEQVIFAGFTHEPAARLAESLIPKLPHGLTRIFLSDNGSTAVEVALKIAMQYFGNIGQKREAFLALEHAYHGDTFGAMAASAPSVFTAAFGELRPEVIRLPFPELKEDELTEEREGKFLQNLREILRTHSSKIAAFIFEPEILAAGGMKVWRREILEAAIATCREFGVLTIADEVLTGFGRTGRMFVTQELGQSPDLLTMSKGITGGFLALGATAVQESIFEAFRSSDPKKTLYHGHSYTANPLACAAACASLEVFNTEPVFDRIHAIKRVHAERLEVFRSRGYETRYLGTIGVIEPKESEGYLSSQMKAVRSRALEQSLLLRPLGDVVYLLPPYSSTSEDVHRAYDIMETILR